MYHLPVLLYCAETWIFIKEIDKNTVYIWKSGFEKARKIF